MSEKQNLLSQRLSRLPQTPFLKNKSRCLWLLGVGDLKIPALDRLMKLSEIRRNRALVETYISYASYVGGADSFSIDALSARAGESVSTTRDRLYAMRDNQFFQDWMFVKDDVFLTEEALQRGKPELRLEEAPTDEAQPLEHYDDALAYVREIRAYNDILPDEAISDALDVTEKTLKTILQEVKNNPSQDFRLRRVVNLYLPQMTGLLETYKDLYQNKKDYAKADQIRTQIIDGVHMFNRALERLLNDMMRDTELDVSSDLAAMKHMLRQDGILESPSPASSSNRPNANE